MRLSGEWSLCDDGVARPVIRGEILGGSGSWIRAEFLVDTGADRTVFSAGVLRLLGLRSVATHERVSGVGGLAESVVVETQLRLAREGGGRVVFRGQYAAVTEPEALDMSVLGRDVTGLFALIVDRPGDVVCFVGQRHHYVIYQS